MKVIFGITLLGFLTISSACQRAGEGGPSPAMASTDDDDESGEPEFYYLQPPQLALAPGKNALSEVDLQGLGPSMHRVVGEGQLPRRPLVEASSPRIRPEVGDIGPSAARRAVSSDAFPTSLPAKAVQGSTLKPLVEGEGFIDAPTAITTFHTRSGFNKQLTVDNVTYTVRATKSFDRITMPKKHAPIIVIAHEADVPKGIINGIEYEVKEIRDHGGQRIAILSGTFVLKPGDLQLKADFDVHAQSAGEAYLAKSLQGREGLSDDVRLLADKVGRKDFSFARAQDQDLLIGAYNSLRNLSAKDALVLRKKIHSSMNILYTHIPTARVEVQVRNETLSSLLSNDQLTTKGLLPQADLLADLAEVQKGATTQVKLARDDIAYATKVDELGRGSFGTVHEYVFATGSEGKQFSVAMKDELRPDLEDPMKELALMQELVDSKHVVTTFGGGRIASDRHAIFMERVTPYEKVNYEPGDLRQLAEGLHDMHSRDIYHRDIKPGNLFVDDFGTLKIGDFGIATKKGSEALVPASVGSPIHMAPELFRSEQLPVEALAAADVWAAGVAIAGKKYFNEIEALYKERGAAGALTPANIVSKGFFDNDLPKVFRDVSTGVASAKFREAIKRYADARGGVLSPDDDLLARMTHVDPAMRPTATEIVDAYKAIDAKRFDQWKVEQGALTAGNKWAPLGEHRQGAGWEWDPALIPTP